MADHCTSSVVSTRRHLVALVIAKFLTTGTRADSYRVEMPNGTGKRTTSRGLPRFSKRISLNFLFHSALNQNFRKFWSNKTRPWT